MSPTNRHPEQFDHISMERHFRLEVPTLGLILTVPVGAAGGVQTTPHHRQGVWHRILCALPRGDEAALPPHECGRYLRHPLQPQAHVPPSLKTYSKPQMVLESLVKSLLKLKATLGGYKNGTVPTGTKRLRTKCVRDKTSKGQNF